MSRFAVLAAVCSLRAKARTTTSTRGHEPNDGDGFYANEDCDDDDALVNPDAASSVTASTTIATRSTV
jgi:hypothetical protein